MKVKYITFATSNWKKCRVRLSSEFNIVNKDLQIFNENDIEDKYFKDFILKQKCVNRGFHNYIWKPYIIYQELQKLQEDIDLLVYFDAGCDFGRSGEYFPVVEKNLSNFFDSNYLLMCFSNAGCPIKEICTDEFKIKHNIDDNFLYKFPHYQAGFICLKNNEWSKKFMLEFKNMMSDDYPEVCEAHFKRGSLKNNGGDQIYMQYLLYKENIRPLCMTNKIIKRIKG